jgi:hypothetical protein
MTHDELLKRIGHPFEFIAPTKALRAVVELHKPYINYKGQECFCRRCGENVNYPCPTIQAIERELR